MLQKIDFKDGKISYDDLTHIDFSIPLKDNADILGEDLLQAKYGDRYTVDVGWYPSISAKGSFVIRVVQDCNWESYLYEKSTKKVDRMIKYLQEAIDMAYTLKNAPVVHHPSKVALMNKIDLLGGKIRNNYFCIDQNLSFEEQKFEYKSNILLIDYGSQYIVDLGWVPEFDEQGSFQVNVIRNNHWQKPLFQKHTREVDAIAPILNEAIGYVDQLMKKEESDQ